MHELPQLDLATSLCWRVSGRVRLGTKLLDFCLSLQIDGRLSKDFVATIAEVLYAP